MNLTLYLDEKQEAQFKQAAALWASAGPGPISPKELALRLLMDGVHAILEDAAWQAQAAQSVPEE